MVTPDAPVIVVLLDPATCMERVFDRETVRVLAGCLMRAAVEAQTPEGISRSGRRSRGPVCRKKWHYDKSMRFHQAKMSLVNTEYSKTGNG